MLYKRSVGLDLFKMSVASSKRLGIKRAFAVGLRWAVPPAYPPTSFDDHVISNPRRIVHSLTMGRRMMVDFNHFQVCAAVLAASRRSRAGRSSDRRYSSIVPHKGLYATVGRSVELDRFVVKM